jgi:hypothetical protein
MLRERTDTIEAPALFHRHARSTSLRALRCLAGFALGSAWIALSSCSSSPGSEATAGSAASGGTGTSQSTATTTGSSTAGGAASSGGTASSPSSDGGTEASTGAGSTGGSRSDAGAAEGGTAEASARLDATTGGTSAGDASPVPVDGSTTGAGDGGTTEGGDGGTTACPGGMNTTITQVMNGTIALGTRVVLSGVVATSPKFLASKGSTGACLWGVFVSEPIAHAVAYSGALVLSTGANAPLDAATGTYGNCPTGSDLIPEDVTAGDVLSVNSDLISYVRASCATSTVPPPSAEVRVANACSIRRDARGHAVPSPATVADVTELTNTATEAVHRKWTGVLVKLDNVSGVDTTASGPVGPTGSIQLTNGVRLRDRIYQLRTSAVFGPMTTWTSIVGLLHLDVCTWALEPRDPCTDFNPKSQNCP